MSILLDPDQINADHKDRYRGAQVALDLEPGSRLPLAIDLQLGEITRQEWIRYGKQRDGQPEEPVRKVASKNLGQFVQEHVGLQINPPALAEETDSSISTVHRFIAEHAGSFRKLERGMYEIRDPRADRNAERAVSAPKPNPGVVQAERAMAQFDGRVGKP